MVANRTADPTHLDRLFHALADATRRDIVMRSLAGELSVSGLARLYPMSVAAVQKHVAVLVTAGLVATERRGRERIVRTDPSALARAHDALDALEAAWRDRVARMDEILDDPREGDPPCP